MKSRCDTRGEESSGKIKKLAVEVVKKTEAASKLLTTTRKNPLAPSRRLQVSGSVV
jgi:hypothetical protein